MYIYDIELANKRAGHHFFDAETMRFFQSRILSEVFEGPGGVYFVTSERFVDSRGHSGPRKFTVRYFNPQNGDCGTVNGTKGGYQAFASASGAKGYAKRLSQKKASA